MREKCFKFGVSRKTEASKFFKKLTICFDIFRTLYGRKSLCGAAVQESKRPNTLCFVDFKEKKIVFPSRLRE